MSDFEAIVSNIPEGTGGAISNVGGSGGFLGGLTDVVGGVVGLFEKDEAGERTRAREALLAEREFELEKLRVQATFPPPPSQPAAPVSLPAPTIIQSIPSLPKGLSPALLIGGLGLLGAAIFLGRRRKR